MLFVFLTVFTIGSSGKDYTSAQAAESAIPANPTDDYELRIEEAFNAGIVTINVSNTNNQNIHLTAAAAYRFYQESDWPDAYRAVTGGARIEHPSGATSGLEILTDHVEVSWLGIIKTGGSGGRCINVEGLITGTEIHHNLIFAQQTGQDGIRRTGNVSAGSETHEFYNNWIVGANIGMRLVDFDVTIRNNTIVGWRASGRGQYGIYADGSDVTAKNMICVGHSSSCYFTINSGTFSTKTDCLASDATGSGGALNNVDPTSVIEDYTWVSGSVKLNTNQPVRDEVLYLERFRHHTTTWYGGGKAAYSFHDDGTLWWLEYSLDAASFSDLQLLQMSGGWDRTGTDWTFYVEFYVSSTYDAATVGSWSPMDLNAGATNVVRVTFLNTAGQLQIRVTRSGLTTMTAQDLTPGTEYKLRIQFNRATNPNGQMIVDLAAKGATFSEVYNQTGDTSGAAVADRLRCVKSSSAVDVGEFLRITNVQAAPGFVDLDEIDEGIGGMGDDLTGNTDFQGSDESSTAPAFSNDIENQTRSDWYIGAYEIVSAVATGNPWYYYQQQRAVT